MKYVAPEDIIVYSIDEVFMDVTDYLSMHGLSPHGLAKKIIQEVLEMTGITATAGIGTNLYLAKIAMDIMAKHIPADENGVRIALLDEMSYRRELWAHRPLTDFWRVGKGYAKKLEANGMTMTLIPAIEHIYKDDEVGKREAYARSQQFFNTHAVPFAFIAGLVYAMEKEHKENNSVDGKTIESVKAALMGPTAGMFDSLFFNCLRIIAAGIGIGLCAEGNILGSILFVLIYGVSQSVCKYFFVNWGYIYGTSFIDMIFNSGLMGAFTKSASVLGIMMVGAMTAQMVNVPINWTLNIGQTSLVVGDVLNSIFPGFLSVCLLFWLVHLIKKGIRPTTLILIILVISLLGAFVGIF